MSYNRINILKRMIDIQNIVLDHKEHGSTQEWIYNNIIYPTYKISRATYYYYLGTNAKAELKKIMAAKAAQATLF